MPHSASPPIKILKSSNNTWIAWLLDRNLRSASNSYYMDIFIQPVSWTLPLTSISKETYPVTQDAFHILQFFVCKCVHLVTVSQNRPSSKMNEEGGSWCLNFTAPHTWTRMESPLPWSKCHPFTPPAWPLILVLSRQKHIDPLYLIWKWFPFWSACVKVLKWLLSLRNVCPIGAPAPAVDSLE